MSGGRARPPGGRGPARSDGPLRSAGGPEGVWACRHAAAVGGSFDESIRRASHQELAVARVLAAEGHQVRTVAERRGARTPDLVACGTSVEVKSFQSLPERKGRAPTAEGVANKLLDARGQGAMAVIWGRGSGLTAATARAGYEGFCQRAREEGPGRVRAVRLVGDGFDMSFVVAAVRLVGCPDAGQARPGPPAPARRRTTSGERQSPAAGSGRRQPRPETSLGQFRARPQIGL